MSLNRALFASAALSLLLVTAGLPQASTAIVSGTVRDQSGAVIPNAPVVLTGIATNVSSTIRTNEAGLFFFPGVVVGDHRLSVEYPGMERFEGTLTVQVGQRVVIDPVLKPGQTTTSVEVRDVTPLVNSTNPTVRTTLESERIEQLPINGRSITTLLATIPGYEGGRLFGTPAASQEWIPDGAVVSERRWSTGSPQQPPLDDILLSSKSGAASFTELHSRHTATTPSGWRAAALISAIARLSSSGTSSASALQQRVFDLLRVPLR